MVQIELHAIFVRLQFDILSLVSQNRLIFSKLILTLRLKENRLKSKFKLIENGANRPDY